MQIRAIHFFTMATALSAIVTAGPLTPPAGPIAPTYKTLQEVEPRTPVQSLPGSATAVYVISQPGSYYLTGNITGVAGKNGIVIASNDVSLDLNGFTLAGVPGSGHAITGGTNGENNLTFRNGTVRGWGGSGVYGFNRNILVSDILTENNGGYGIGVGGQAGITRCIARANGGFAGIGVAYWSTITDCVSRENSGAGFEAEASTVLRGNLSQSNQGNGIQVDNTCTVENNLANDNQGDGIRVGYAGAVFGNRIENNNVVNNATGIQVTSGGNTIIKNNAYSNGTNYVISGGNVFPPTIDPTTAMTNTNPNANIGF